MSDTNERECPPRCSNGYHCDKKPVGANKTRKCRKIGLEKEDKYAIIDSIQCFNPHDEQKSNKIREHTNIENHNNEHDYWIQVKNKYNIPDWKGNQTFSSF